MTLKSMKPLTRAPLLHVSVQESLRAYIDDNGLAPGTLLPAEGELATQLGVSRNSLREGIKALESLGVLETRRGVGIFVPPSAAEPWISDQPRFLAIMEALDRTFARSLPIFGDHVLYQFRRTTTQ